MLWPVLKNRREVATMTQNVASVKATATINLLAAIWLFISPWVYGIYSRPDAWNNWIVAVLIAIFAVTRMSNPMGTRGVSFINLLLGAWTFASPWIYGYTGDHGRFVNSLIVGVIVFIVGAVGSSVEPSNVTPHPARI